MYRFQLSVPTQMGESVGLVGSVTQLGQWDVTKCVHLRTSSNRHPLWWIDIAIDTNSQPQQTLEYKYIRLSENGQIEWESGLQNRWIPLESDHHSKTLIVEDCSFNHIQSSPYGYYLQPQNNAAVTKPTNGLKILLVGSSVALGCSAWLLKGWAWHLQQALQQRFGHQLINRSIIGANTATIIQRLPEMLATENPDIVIISLSLGNEGLAYCVPRQQQALQQRFENGLQQLLKITEQTGTRCILGGVYPHGDYSWQHHSLLKDTRKRMLTWGVPVLDWLPVLNDGRGRWKKGISFDVAHPNTKGHQLMYEAINLSLFEFDRHQVAKSEQIYLQQGERLIYRDKQGFSLFSNPHSRHLRIINPSPHSYTITPSWQELQNKLHREVILKEGIYIDSSNPQSDHGFFGVDSQGMITKGGTPWVIATSLHIPPSSNLEYIPIADYLASKSFPVIFEDGDLKLLQEKDNLITIINQSPHDYNIHPMWKEIRAALKAVPSGVYQDPIHPETPFRTLLIGPDGLESRVKIPARSLVYFQYQCQLSEIKRIAILPLGDRCAARMLLYKMEYDGPAFPFDLTRTTNLADITDIIVNDFSDMWNPHLLHYNDEEKRIYHTKWSGLSFAHEVEETENPLEDMTPIFERMRSRYSARANRFRYTLDKSDEVIFIRTGSFDRGSVSDLVSKLQTKYPHKPFRLLLIYPQSSEEIAGIPHVWHYPLEFNPEKMCEDSEHWKYCADELRNILGSLGISSKNLFWCPPNVTTREKKPQYSSEKTYIL